MIARVYGCGLAGAVIGLALSIAACLLWKVPGAWTGWPGGAGTDGGLVLGYLLGFRWDARRSGL